MTFIKNLDNSFMEKKKQKKNQTGKTHKLTWLVR